MKNNASVKALLFRSKTLKNGEHPIMLRVIKDRKSKYVSTGYSSDPKLWDFQNELPSKKHPNKLKLELLIKEKVRELTSQVLDLDLKNKDFTANTVIEKAKRKKAAYNVVGYFDETIFLLRKANRLKYADTFQTCKNIVVAFSKKQDLAFNEIDFSFMTKFESYLKEKGWKDTSIASYFRTLRALFNKAINEGIVTPEIYPFKKYKISKLNLKTQKRAIKLEQIKSIENLKLNDNLRLKDAQFIFLFSFYTMGTNYIDIANLTWEKIEGGRLKYVRAKTKKHYNIVLSEKAQEILSYYQNRRTDKYIFPILFEHRHITAQQKLNRLHRQIQLINDDLRVIAKKCGISENLTTYVARHSAATILKRKGVSTSVISELLGHETENITQVYLDSFESPVLDTAVSLL